MKWIGLTGGLGTGKSTVAKILREFGCVVLDADRMAADVITSGTTGLRSVVQRFGNDFLLSNGQLDRKKMSREVFGNPEALSDLEAIIHPLVKVEVERHKELEKRKGSDLLFYDVPLLYEKNISGFDAVVVVASSYENQKLRIRQRNPWSEDEINNRLKSQLPLSQKIQKANYVIFNDGTLENLKIEVEKLLATLKK